MEVKTLKRVFVYTGDDKEKINLPDPNPKMSVEEVIEHYTSQYPKLQNAVSLPGEQKGDVMNFEIRNNFGTKG